MDIAHVHYLPESKWAKLRPRLNCPDYSCFFPEKHRFINLTYLGQENQQYIAWGGWYREIGNGNVLTCASNWKSWRQSECYRYLGDFLQWFTGVGAADYYRIYPEEFPEDLIKLVSLTHLKIDESNPPPLPELLD